MEQWFDTGRGLRLFWEWTCDGSHCWQNVCLCWCLDVVHEGQPIAGKFVKDWGYSCDASLAVVGTRYLPHRYKSGPQTCCCRSPRSMTLVCTYGLRIHHADRRTWWPLWDHVSLCFGHFTVCNDASQSTPCCHSIEP